uniref:Uncharacterized protein n=1 Tax=Astyanax mexicanus TaxID=7994 RepID=A0A8B9GZQ5_ASTMX
TGQVCPQPLTQVSTCGDHYKSAFFFFEGTFYNDMRFPECRDISTCLYETKYPFRHLLAILAILATQYVSINSLNPLSEPPDLPDRMHVQSLSSDPPLVIKAYKW